MVEVVVVEVDHAPQPEGTTSASVAVEPRVEMLVSDMDLVRMMLRLVGEFQEVVEGCDDVESAFGREVVADDYVHALPVSDASVGLYDLEEGEDVVGRDAVQLEELEGGVHLGGESVALSLDAFNGIGLSYEEVNVVDDTLRELVRG